MPIRSYKPTSPGRRQMTVLTYEEITRTEPERSLLAPLRKKGGRNNQGPPDCSASGRRSQKTLSDY